MDQIKNHISLILTIITLVTAMFAFDARYAHAEETKQVVAALSVKLEQSNKETQQAVLRSTNTLRQQILEDKIFEIDTKQALRTATPVDVALKARYLRQLQETK